VAIYVLVVLSLVLMVSSSLTMYLLDDEGLGAAFLLFLLVDCPLILAIVFQSMILGGVAA
jgi:hypothetical protein